MNNLIKNKKLIKLNIIMIFSLLMICIWASISYAYDFGYTGGVQTYQVPSSGIYKLEVWGGQGGNSIGNLSATGGLGGYSFGNIYLTKDTVLYVTVGGKGANGKVTTTSDGGYNGGGKGSHDDHLDPDGYYEAIADTAGGGGGATHIATVLRGSGTKQGLLTQYESHQDEVLLVAGGVGGASYSGPGGEGGGRKGGKNKYTSQNTVNQSSGYKFGKGQDGEGYGHSNGIGGGRRRLVPEDIHVQIQM